jgi:hypothetical protein
MSKNLIGGDNRNIAFIGEDYEPEVRIARDPETGKNMYISNMNFEAWAKAFDVKPINLAALVGPSVLPKDVVVRKYMAKVEGGTIYDERDVALVNATPNSGKITKQAGGRFLPKEADGAEWLNKTLGGNIFKLAEAKVPKIRMADVKWRRKLLDFKNIIGSKSSVANALREGAGQVRKGGVILLNVSKRERSLALIVPDVLHNMERYSVSEVILRDGDKLVAYFVMERK